MSEIPVVVQHDDTIDDDLVADISSTVADNVSFDRGDIVTVEPIDGEQNFHGQDYIGRPLRIEQAVVSTKPNGSVAFLTEAEADHQFVDRPLVAVDEASELREEVAYAQLTSIGYEVSTVLGDEDYDIFAEEALIPWATYREEHMDPARIQLEHGSSTDYHYLEDGTDDAQVDPCPICTGQWVEVTGQHEPPGIWVRDCAICGYRRAEHI